MREYEFRSASGLICCSTDNPEYLCSSCKAKLAAGGTHRVMELRTAARPVVKKTMAEHREDLARQIQGFGTVVLDTPDAYASATYPVRPAPCPYDSPDYAPHGQPPDPYAAGIERLRKEKK